MKAFATLLDRLVLTPSRNGKLTLLADYFRDTPDPDRGYGLAALAGGLDLKSVKPAMLRDLVLERMDPVLFQYSYDYVGDLAETISLVWDGTRKDEIDDDHQPRLSEVVTRMNALGRTEVRSAVRDLLDKLDTSSRFAFLKLVTGALRIGVSARLAKQALSDMSGKDVTEIETLWHGLTPPYEPLFAWLEGRAEKPVLATPAIFHSVMLANPVETGDLEKLDPADYAAEWKWDGIRVQMSSYGGTKKLYSRSGDDITGAFPDVVGSINFEGVIDGELLVGGTARSNNPTRTFSDLQQRLNRKTVTGRMLDDYPAFVRAYDLLFESDLDIRAESFLERRRRLGDIIQRAPHDRFDLSELVSFATWDELDRIRIAPPDPVIEGVMIKRKDSPYQAGRLKGPWFKWKRDPYNIDAVMLYAQRGHGKRSSYYSDFTFGVWAETPDGEELVPVGKAYFGFTDAELEVLDKFVRDNTVDRFGPVRAVRAERDFGFVLEVAFEGINRSTRHKSGVAMRFPRIARLRYDKLPRDADRLSTLTAMLDAKAG
ncbi:cisplatin damage response ATP-dependent DNA ligase [Neorhizobium galegae]|uniref:cisplatin damage response ATP-dependent DNA ligase n=1 Tax=Neorhizobium galegae TaxID=399 RepID=UPI000621BD00|nr:cisplatin damage response ATP-dependent DNA ligase [Neorhizobium galegae]CDZ29519.1 ATP-dependent DNA ligase [Neorhizobium galegae bv. officinalis]KAA9386271.1 cisplatin damage response ATP-dependent DNA ligase [Neorhizobium galegae]KAB1112872.1 cisplatin damage response ATP-dependent DNA ligase [Neorhizobium galegae]MCM2500674.1 cisplatin damage response ATP-dependent DNA ligase [Neorhizobium galegae]MCQ1770633.1 cisplatin damage response ATP-dependent DNA ligase [Neorhizobium galegae]